MSAPRSFGEPVAIVGASCRFPGASDPEAYWQRLVELPASPPAAASTAPRLLEHVDRFDAAFFGLSAHEASRMEPQQRLLLELLWEAAEHGGQTLAALQRARTGVFVGVLHNDYEAAQYRATDPSTLDLYVVTGGRDLLAQRLSYSYGLRGPSLTLDTACSSGLSAVHLACQSLRLGESDIAIAGGVNLIHSTHITRAFTRARLLAPDGTCKPFDGCADGIVRSDGASLVVLKPLERALADGDPVVALIHGAAMNNDGGSSGSLVRPSSDGQTDVLLAAQQCAGVSPEWIGYVECHAAGTYRGDPAEIAALQRVFGGRDGSYGPLRIGSVKGLVGHMEGAAGVAALLKVALGLERRLIPPGRPVTVPHPEIPLEQLSLRVQTCAESWPETQPFAGVSSFGLGGTNVHLVLGPAPSPAPAVVSPRHRWPFLFSARSPEAVRAALTRILECTEPRDGDASHALAYTLAVRRTHHQYRLAVLAHDLAALQQHSRAWLESDGQRGVLGATDGELTPRCTEWVAGAEIDWSEVIPPTRCLRLPTYSWQRERYWRDDISFV